MQISITPLADDQLPSYVAWLKSRPEATLWQSMEWKRLQEGLGRETRLYVALDGADICASALVVIDRTAGGFSTWEVPRGPVWGLGDGAWGVGPLLDRIVSDAKRDRCFSLYFSPATLPHPTPDAPYPSQRHIQPEATRIIDLTATEEQILAQMKPKGRYNIGVAEKHGVQVEESRDCDTFHTLLRQTAGRDGFGILPARHYRAFLEHLPGSFLLLAHTGEKPVAGLMGVRWGTTGIYYYGASSHADRALMAPYLLQWEAMRRCKAAGCRSYDLLGVAPPESGPEHPWAGISVFKEKFGGSVVTYPPEQELTLRPLVKRLIGLKRAIIG